MPVARVNDIELNYKLEGDGEDTIVLINGLADDLETWVLQMDDFLAAGYRVLRFDTPALVMAGEEDRDHLRSGPRAVAPRVLEQAWARPGRPRGARLPPAGGGHLTVVAARLGAAGDRQREVDEGRDDEPDDPGKVRAA
jgi:alpha-beta hydrolase superfamily lysophospholipase